ncbi:hypothetical protein GCG54_00014413 [Colletotrichum gloeosporioides]|uniref:Uncharacterized protein n=1 Tax=Colletotrichum gloeosporioides TaxID=474922 RepID=A0A8H4FRF5_COLGL|nr:uncharacterized protein GCG54_00014413 [Colletotrichum gloeosporioides]KAF3811667.1 hypothetical protein GCG54_00014413 [Colletotrichum gloeosporioides]
MFEGGRVPFVLRPNEDGLYSLVGECYVHGLMHGEWKRPNRKVKFQTTSFALK